METVSKTSYKRIISIINREAKSWRKREKSKYESKAEHIRNIRKIEEEKILEICPRELYEYRELKIFNKREMENMKKEEVTVSKIGNVKLDEDELALLRLPPKFAVINKLDDLDMRTDIEMACAKIRYQIHKEDKLKDIDEENEIYSKNKKRKILTIEEIREMDDMEKLDAEGRRIYDPIERIFNINTVISKF